MRHRTLTSWGLIAAALTLAACQGASPTEPTPPGTAIVQPAAANFSQVQGLVIASANVIAAGGSNVIAAGGGNFRTLADGLAPVVGAEVFLADAHGQPVPGYASTRTDDKGHYSFPHVPTGYTFTVVVRLLDAQGKPFNLETLFTSQASGNVADVTLASTLATRLLTEGRDGSMGEIDATKFEAIVKHFEARLAAAPPIDMSDSQAVLSSALALVADDPVIQTLVTEVKASIVEVKAPLTTLPTPAPSPAATATPAPNVPSAGPTTPTPAATPVVDGVPGGGGAAGVTYPAPTLTLAATSFTGIATGIDITILHNGAALDIMRPDTIQVNLSSPSEPAGETVTLTETGNATGTFHGVVPFERLYNNLGTLATTANNGKIAVNAEGATLQETVTVTYLTKTQTVTYEEPKSTLTGIVKIAGTPKAYAQVQINQTNGTFVAKTASRADGSYAIRDLAPGTYAIVIAVNGAVTQTGTVTIPTP